MESEDTRLGRIAYEAYCKMTGWQSAITGCRLPPFEKVPEGVKEGWIAAEKAVRNDALHEELMADLGK